MSYKLRVGVPNRSHMGSQLWEGWKMDGLSELGFSGLMDLQDSTED